MHALMQHQAMPCIGQDLIISLLITDGHSMLYTSYMTVWSCVTTYQKLLSTIHYTPGYCVTLISTPFKQSHLTVTRSSIQQYGSITMLYWMMKLTIASKYLSLTIISHSKPCIHLALYQDLVSLLIFSSQTQFKY